MDAPRIRTGHERTTNVPIAEQDITLTKKSLLSPREVTEETGEHVHLDGVMQSVLKDLMVNPERERKYKNFLSGAFTLAKIWRTAGLPDVETRFRAFILTYIQQRYFDDVIDGDTPQKVSPADRVKYATERLRRLRTGPLDPSDTVDGFAIKILADIEKLDPRYVETAKRRLGEIMSSILFDGRRIQKWDDEQMWQFIPRDELSRHFYQLDIEGTIGMSLFLFGFKDSPRNMNLLKHLGSASRIAYNLRDFTDDIKAGLCNISKEDAEQSHPPITQEDLRAVVTAGNDVSSYPNNIKAWLRKEAERGLMLLGRHTSLGVSNLELQDGQQAPRSRIHGAGYKKLIAPPLFYLVYTHSARKTFLETLRAVS